MFNYIVNRFDKWKKVNDGKRCAFLKHIGCSQHKDAMTNKFLADSLVVHIEKEIADTFDSNSIIDVFKNFKGRQAELQLFFSLTFIA